MGKGNVCVYGEYEGLFYIDWDNFSNEYENENGEMVLNYDFQRDEMKYSIEEFKVDFSKKYKSFSECEKWLGSSEKAIMENELFYIALEDNEWSMAVKLIQKENDYYSNYNILGLQAGLYKKYLEGIKKCLFNQFDELGIYGGAWTHGKIKRDA